MAKVPFTKLKCKIDDSVKELKLSDGTIVEVKQYLPIQEKLSLVGKVIELAHDQDFNYSNPMKTQVFLELEILFAYSNIVCTDKQKEDLPKLYDALKSSGILLAVLDLIPAEEIHLLSVGVHDSAEAFYAYQNSILGVLDVIKTDYKNMKLDIDSLIESVADPTVVSFVKDMLTNVN